jgi:hypothetical protein
MAERLARAPGVLWRDLPGEVLLLDDSMTTPVAVVGPTAEVWDLLDVPRTVEELVHVLATTHGETEDVVGTGVRATIDELVARGLVVPAPHDQ